MSIWSRFKAWLTPAYDASRRRALGSAIACLTVPALVKVTSLLPALETARSEAVGDLYAGLTAITRRAFVPKMYVQLYEINPLLALLRENAQSPRTRRFDD